MKQVVLDAILILGAAGLQSAALGVDGPSSPSGSSGLNILKRGADYSVVEWVRPNSQGLGYVTNRYTILGNGINYQDSNGNWVSSRPEVEAFQSGIVCTGASYEVILGTNLNTPGAVDLLTSDKARIISRPIGISFYDPVTGKRVMVAQVRDCQPEIASTNQIVYADAFDGNGIRASVVYQYDAGRFSQDVKFLESPSVTPAGFGLSDRTRLEVLTEIEQSPPPRITRHVLQRERDPQLRATMAQPDLMDETLSFGQMRMSLGHAFPSQPTRQDPVPRGLPVGKRLLHIDGQVVLAEDVPWAEVAKQLADLPHAVANAGTRMGRPRSISKVHVPTDHAAPGSVWDFKARLARITRSRPILLASSTTAQVARSVRQRGFVMDYVTVQGGGPTTTFQSGVTYLVEGQVSLFGTTTFNPGAIIKYAPYATLTVEGSVSALYFGGTVVLTSENDNSVGSEIDNSTGNPQAAPSAGWSIIFEYLNGDTTFGPLDIRYAYGGIDADNSAGHTLTLISADFTDVIQGIQAGQIASVGINYVSICCPDYPTTGTILYQEAVAGTVSLGTVSTCVSDLDNDGLPDTWEYTYFGTLGQTATSDPDGDGLSNAEEYQDGTNPTISNSAIPASVNIITCPQ